MAESSKRVMYEMHSHTTLCKHATGEVSEYAAVAWARGLRGLAVTCHNAMPDGYSASVRMSPEQWPEYVEMVGRAAEEWEGRMEVLLGLECDYFPGVEKWLERQVEAAGLNHVLGSVHPQVREYRQRFWRDDPLDYQRTYFEHLALAGETGLFDTLSHPDLVKNETPGDWRLEHIMDDIRRSLDRIARAGCAMELNTSGLDKAVREMNPGPEVLREMRLREIPVVIGADAHVPRRVGDRYEQALGLLAEAGYTSVSYFVERQRREVSIELARRSLAVDG